MEQSHAGVDDLNRISISEARAIIGKEGLAHLDEILKHLFATLPDLMGEPREAPITTDLFDYRYAPSVVARNEAELFGISSPRFAVRVSQSHGIFNLRRLQHLISAVGHEWSERRSGAKPLADVRRIDNPDKTPAETFKKSRCIADAVIVGAVDLLTSKSFRVLTAELGTPYGEGTQITGVPYVEHIPLGGGLCAQAACLMCTLLLHHISLGVHGAAEITALTVDPSSDEFMLSGMTPIRITKYFRSSKVGLASGIEIASSDYYDECDDLITLEGLYAYVRSGLPAVVPVDAGRMALQLPGETYSDSIFKTNRIVQPSERKGGIEPKNHAIVAVGARRTSRFDQPDDREKLEFLINDPSRCPMLLATGKQLIRARAYRDIKQDRLPTIEDLAKFQFVSVRPVAVRLPLLSTVALKPDGTKEYVDGMFDASFRLLTSDAISILGVPKLGRKEAQKLLPGVVRLALISCKHLPERFSSFAIARQHDLDIACRSIITDWMDTHRIALKWIWVQLIIPGSRSPIHGKQLLLLWNAEVPAQDATEIGTAPEGFVLAAFRRDGESTDWMNCWNSPGLSNLPADTSDPLAEEDVDELIQEVNDVQDCMPSAGRLEPAIISSFAIPRFEQVVSRWPAKADGSPFHCELYSFMRPTESKNLLGHGTAERQLGSATSEMAAMVRTSGAVDSYADWFRDQMVSNGVQIPVVALASFIPEVTCQIDSPRWEMATKAIEFMIRLGDRIAVGSNSPRLIIEMVAGSRIDGLWPGEGEGDYEIAHGGLKTRYFANRMSEREGIVRLLRCLQTALHAAIPSPDDARIAIALELEPGPLYLLNSFESVIAIDAAIRATGDPFLEKLVGFNLDIAHWKMAGIKPGDLREPRSRGIAKRILHSHLSGHHGRAHLGDAPLDKATGFGIRRSTIEWLNLLKEFSQVQGRVPLHVSLEYEAAKNAELLRRSSRTLEWALRFVGK